MSTMAKPMITLDQLVAIDKMAIRLDLLTRRRDLLDKQIALIVADLAKAGIDASAPGKIGTRLVGRQQTAGRFKSQLRTLHKQSRTEGVRTSRAIAKRRSAA